MELKENIDILMSNVTMGEDMHRAIMEGRPGRKYRVTSRESNDGRQITGTGKSMDMRNRKKTVWKQAAIPAAAVILVMSTMYVGAGYLMEHTPLRDLFVAKDDSALPVPEEQQRPDIYGEIMDASFSSGADFAETGMEAGGDSATGAGEEAVPRGKYGELVIDNDWYSIELLETICTGRELNVSYILTEKTDQILTVNVSVDNAYLGQWRDGMAGEEYDVTKCLMKSSFGDSFRWNKLPEGCGYELAENQKLCYITQLGKEDYASGTYTLYAEAYLQKTVASEDAEETGEESQFTVLEASDGDVQERFDRAFIEIIGNSNYGFALEGAIDKTEEQVHFDQYEIYISPMTVYLTFEGTYQGEVSEIWGMCRSHDITIGFADGTQTKATVYLSGMGYGFGNIDVDMNASFDTAIDPDSIVKVALDNVVLMEK